MMSLTFGLFTQVSLGPLGPLVLEKHCHRSSALINYPISIYLHTSIGYDYTSNKFAFQHDRVKVKVAVTVFRKTLQLKACQASKGKKILLVHLFL